MEGPERTAERLRVEAGPAEAGKRLDRLLSDALPALSRSRLKALVEDGRVRLAGRIVTEPATRVKNGETAEVEVPAAAPAAPAPERIALAVVYEDAHLIVIDKPAGMVVHPAPGSPEGTLVNALLAHCGDSLSGIGGVRRPGIVHRIDKDTSGLLVVAKTDRAHAGLAEQFARHDLERSYLALVWGVPEPPAGRLEGAIGRSPRDRKKMAVVRQGGRAAVTHYRAERRFADVLALLACRLETGRTHQIRVHLTHAGHPLVGDPVYGRARAAAAGRLSPAAAAAVAAFPRQALHAATLGFRHPIGGQMLRFESPLPADLAGLLAALAAPFP